MKTIPLNKGTLELPDTWDELTYKQKLFAFARLKEVFEGKLSPAMFRILVFGYITGYKPKTDAFSWLFKYMLFYLAVPFVALYYIARLGRIRFSGYWSVWSSRHRPQRYDRSIINYNLYRLSEQIDFAFTIHDHTISCKRYFANNPIPYLEIQGQRFTGKKFILGIASFSNITAREFSDCFDLYMAYSSTDDQEAKSEIQNKIISILYPASADYKENLVSEHADLISILAPEIKFGILYWFSGIVEYYMNHPYYSILFKSDGNEQEDDKIKLGMNEVILMIKKKGYNPDENINDFFDIQLKILKDSLLESISYGITVEELATKIKMSINDINRLV